MGSLLCFVLLHIASAVYPGTPESTPPSIWSSMSGTFTMHCSPFGISIFAMGWPQDKFRHACNLLAQFIDNDQDGCADDPAVVRKIRQLQSGMAMFANENDAATYENSVASSFRWQGL